MLEKRFHVLTHVTLLTFYCVGRSCDRIVKDQEFYRRVSLNDKSV